MQDVYKGMYRKKVIAIADIRGHLTDMDVKELGLLRDLRHPNIVHFIGVSIPKEPLSSVPVMIVTELCANGDLFDYIRGVSHPPFLSMLEIMLGISRGLEYLHTRTPGIIHRDIKSSNVLITANGTAKLNDFGLARVSQRSGQRMEFSVSADTFPGLDQEFDTLNDPIACWNSQLAGSGTLGVPPKVQRESRRLLCWPCVLGDFAVASAR